jgi:hypothetical protein
MKNGAVGILLRLLGRGSRAPMLGGLVDSLLQSFENCRVGLSDETLRGGEKVVHQFFLELYEKEFGRIEETVRLFETGLPASSQEAILARVDELGRKVVLPAYARLATRFTRRERNDFYLLPEPLHGIERFGWGVAGMGLGGFVVWAPFIPLWEKEWVLPFVALGLLFPNIRRYFTLRRYQSDLNGIVAHADDEIRRAEVAQLTTGEVLSDARPRHVVSTSGPTTDGAVKPKARQGGR